MPAGASLFELLQTRQAVLPVFQGHSEIAYAWSAAKIDFDIQWLELFISHHTRN